MLQTFVLTVAVDDDFALLGHNGRDPVTLVVIKHRVPSNRVR